MDQAFDGDGSDIDDGPLDPSVFFGLFDDLGEDVDPEPEPEPDVDPAEFAGDDRAVDEFDGPATAEVVLDELAPDEVVLDELAPDVSFGDGHSGNGFVVEPAIDDQEAGRPDLEPPASRQATVSWWTTAPDGQPANSDGVSVASPPPVPPSTNGAGTVPTFEFVTAIPDADAGHLPEPDATPVLDIDDSGDLVNRTPLPVEEQRDTGGTMAKATLVAIAISLFGGLVVAFVLSLRSPDPALSGSVAGATDGGDPAAATAVEEPPTGLAGAIATGNRPTAELLTEEFTAALTAALGDRADLTSLRFEPGTVELDQRSALVVRELGALLAEQPTVPVTISVRTYTEQSSADNLALSADQADALTASLVAAGAAPEQVRSRGLGATPLSQAQPVPNFVALTPRFGDHRLDEALDGHSPFALGVPATAVDGAWTLRPDGLLAIGEPAEALSAYPDGQVGAAGYSFLPPSEAGIRTEADAAASQLIDFLVAAYGAERRQISTIIPGSAMFVPTPEHGNHVWLQVGPATRGAFDVASIDPAAITFEPDSAELDTTGLATVQALADVLTTGGATVVIDVRSYDAADATADQALSEARRDALAQALTTAGVAPEQLRMYASGASSYQLDDGGPAITITVAP